MNRDRNLDVQTNDLLAAVSVYQQNGSLKERKISSHEALRMTTWATTIRDRTTNRIIEWNNSDQLDTSKKKIAIWTPLQDIKAAIYRLSAICKAVFFILPKPTQDVYNSQLLMYRDEERFLRKLQETQNILNVLHYIDHWARNSYPNDKQTLPLAEGFLNLNPYPHNLEPDFRYSINRWNNPERVFFEKVISIIFQLLHVAYKLEEHVFFQKRLVRTTPRNRTDIPMADFEPTITSAYGLFFSLKHEMSNRSYDTREGIAAQIVRNDTDKIVILTAAATIPPLPISQYDQNIPAGASKKPRFTQETPHQLCKKCHFVDMNIDLLRMITVPTLLADEIIKRFQEPLFPNILRPLPPVPLPEDPLLYTRRPPIEEIITIQNKEN